MDAFYIIKFILEKLKVPYTETYLGNLVDSNPNKDNLLGLSNILSQYGIQNQAISVNSIFDVTNEDLPAICIFEDDLVIIEKITSTQIEIVSKTGKSTIILSDFEEKWNNILLLYKLTIHNGEPFFKQHLLEKRKKYLCGFFIISTLLILALSKKEYEFPFFLFLLDLLGAALGLYMSYLVKRREYHLDSDVSICSIHHYFDCNIQYTIYKDLKLSDLCVVFFGTFVISLTLFKISAVIVTIITGMTIPVITWSFIYQITKYKRYCPLCAIIQIVLLVLFVVNLFYGTNEFKLILINDIIVLAFAAVIAILIYKRWLCHFWEIKSNNQMFQNRLNSIKENYLKEIMDHPVSMGQYNDIEDFYIGKGNSSNKLYAVLSPFCSPCRLQYLSAYNSLYLLNNVDICFCFICNTKEQREILIRLCSILYQTNDIREVLYDWYYRGVLDHEWFFNKYHYRNLSYGAKISEKHLSWFKKNEVQVSPTFFFNGHRVPKGFTLTDFIYYI